MKTENNTRSQFGMTFSMLSRRWQSLMHTKLSEAGLTSTTWIPLVHLNEFPQGIVQKELASRIGVDTSSLVRVLDILTREGLVGRKPDATDGRAKLVCLTEYGKLRLSDILSELYTWESSVLAALSDEEVNIMSSLFCKINTRLSELDSISKNRDTYE